jgi:uncharacterized protein YjbI with pentapeptide repeats
MHYVRLQFTRDVLVSHQACGEGLDFYDEIADDDGNLTVEWSPLAALWLAWAAPAFSRWLRKYGLIPRAELSGCDLSGMDLSGADLGDANLEATDLSGANLYEVSLESADLYRADLRNANLSYASLVGANLRYAMIGGALLHGAELDQVDIKNIDISIRKE